MATDPAPPEPTIPCETCGYPTTMLETRRCNRCFAVEGHLPEYVKTAAGRAFVEGVLGRVPADGRKCPTCKHVHLAGPTGLLACCDGMGICRCG